MYACLPYDLIQISFKETFSEFQFPQERRKETNHIILVLQTEQEHYIHTQYCLVKK